MSLEKAIEALTAAVIANTAALTVTGTAPAAAPASAAPAAPRTRARPETAPAPAPTAAPAVDKKALIGKLTELCNIPNGRATCTALCVKYGSATKNASGLDPSTYATVAAEAQALIDEAASNPAG